MLLNSEIPHSHNLNYYYYYYYCTSKTKIPKSLLQQKLFTFRFFKFGNYSFFTHRLKKVRRIFATIAWVGVFPKMFCFSKRTRVRFHLIFDTSNFFNSRKIIEIIRWDYLSFFLLRTKITSIYVKTN